MQPPALPGLTLNPKPYTLDSKDAGANKSLVSSHGFTALAFARGRESMVVRLLLEKLGSPLVPLLPFFWH